MKIYLICPVRMATDETTQFAKEYVEEQESNRQNEVFWPQRDVDQDGDDSGLNIVETELKAIRDCDEVHIIWNKDSKGSHFDLGAAMALDKPLVLVKSLYDDVPEKSYEKVIKIKEMQFSLMRLYL